MDPITLLIREAISGMDTPDGWKPSATNDKGIGAKIEALSKATGITDRTLYRWRRKAPDFSALVMAWAVCSKLEIPLEEFYDAVAETARENAQRKPKHV